MIHVLLAPIAVLALGLSIGGQPVDDRHDRRGNHYDSYDDNVVLFSDAGFRGEALLTDESIRNLRRFDFSDDISSFYVPEGFVVTFYDERKFRGRCFTVEGPTRVRRVDCPWDDVIRSVKVVRTCAVQPTRYERDDRQDRKDRLERKRRIVKRGSNRRVRR